MVSVGLRGLGWNKAQRHQAVGRLIDEHDQSARLYPALAADLRLP